MAVSPESMQASPPSRIALATSVTSARVGPARVLHAVEHLRGHDHRLLVLVAHGDDGLLHDRHLGHVDFHAQVAAGHHDAVGRRDDLFQLVEGFLLFDLGDHFGPRAARAQQFFEQANFDRRAHEAETDEVGVVFGRPLGVRPVGLAHRRNAELGARQIHPLAAAHEPGLHDAALHEIRSLFFDQHAHAAVGQHDLVADFHFVHQRLVGANQLVRLLARRCRG